MWTAEQANAWYAKQPWLVGSNYLPSYAINQLEMWQPETFDLRAIDRELAAARGLGMNTARVFLHDLLWESDRDGFIRRLDAFLAIAERNGIKPLIVFFDSVWAAEPKAGPQPAPRIGVHNSRWVQSPGVEALADRGQYPRLENYVRGVVREFADDRRILGWDVWNEPDNLNSGQDSERKLDHVEFLLPKVFDWVREAEPVQPITSGVWNGNWSSDRALNPIERIQLRESDVISFHNYGDRADFEKRVGWLEAYGRPLMVTEYMARTVGSTFQAVLPVARKRAVAVYNWGLFAGRSQTYYPWDSTAKPYPDGYPDVWFHDILYPDGTPYDQTEVDFLRSITRGTGAGERSQRAKVFSARPSRDQGRLKSLDLKSVSDETMRKAKKSTATDRLRKKKLKPVSRRPI